MSEPSPVEPCQGFTKNCLFCNKRFSSWLPAEEEEIEKVPTEPGVYMFALKSKSQQETVLIGMHNSNIQQSIFSSLQNIKQQITDRKSKESKSTILFCYTTFKNADNKDICLIYAHWQNFGILPRLTSKWPGTEILKNTQHFEYLETNKKWCHPLKNPVWKKNKTSIPEKAVPKCKSWAENYSACSICDNKFTSWIPLSECTEKQLAPSNSGLCMFGISRKDKNENTPEVLSMHYYTNIAKGIWQDNGYVQYTVKNVLRSGEMPEAQVRWMENTDEKSEECCFLYAHWCNTGSKPYMMRKMLGEEILANSELFVLRQKDQRWCTIDKSCSKPIKTSKSKEKKHLIDSIKEQTQD